MIYSIYIKRIIDFFIAIISIVVLSPVLIIVSSILSINNKGTGIFFTQDRPGKNGIIFKAIKFKTMTDQRDSNGELLPDKDRLTRVGKFIRSTSLDELPQLFNILLGNMSLIGPRPLLVKYLSLYSPEQFRRHEVKPGLTGWAQINGRNNISWKKKFELDVWYVDNISFALDLKIFFITIKKTLLREDISKAGEATTEAFNGRN
jgi:lipopolysaccharide/colanic/teichoic acid biosynthesis glycosyltransferase